MNNPENDVKQIRRLITEGVVTEEQIINAPVIEARSHEQLYRDRFKITVDYDPQKKGEEFFHSNVWKVTIEDLKGELFFQEAWYKPDSAGEAMFQEQQRYIDLRLTSFSRRKEGRSH